MPQPLVLNSRIRPRGDVTIGTRRPPSPSISAGDLAKVTAASALEDIASGAGWIDEQYQKYVPRELREIIEAPDPSGNIDALLAKSPATLAKGAMKGANWLSNLENMKQLGVDMSPVAGMTVTPRTFNKFKGLYNKLWSRFEIAKAKGLPVQLPTGEIDLTDVPPEEVEKLAFGITRFPTTTMRFPMSIESLPGNTSGTFINATPSQFPRIILDPDKADFIDSFLHETGGHGIDWLRYPTQHKNTRAANISKRDPELIRELGNKVLMDRYWTDPGEQTAREVGYQALAQKQYYQDMEKNLAALGFPTVGDLISDAELDSYLMQAHQRGKQQLRHGIGNFESIPLPSGEFETYSPAKRTKTKGQVVSKRKREE